MPSPDTETLAARLRAVERALTDEDATLDPPNGGVATEAPEPDTAAATSGVSGPEPDVADRLCRLEAAVQALHAALDECDTDPDRASGIAAEAVTDGRRTTRKRGHDSREPSTDWPDDLAAE